MGGEKERGGAPGRAKHLREAAAANDTGAAFTLTRGELAALVSSAVGEALERGAPTRVRLLDRAGAAAALSCSPATVDKLRRAGMPCVYLGDSPRFDVETCVEWLRERGHSDE